MTARALALAALAEWREGRQFADAIIQRLLAESSLSGSDRGFATELFYGILRNLTLLDFWIGQLRSGSLDHKTRDLLRLGLYQIFVLRTPGHAAVFETVKLSQRNNRGLINGVLRTALRQEDELQKARAAQSLATRFSHPAFLIERWRDAYGEEAATLLCEWNNQPPPVYARINRLRTTVEKFLRTHPNAEPVCSRDNFIRLAAIPFEALELGHCYIQDPSTAVACELFDPQPGETILDACAAPGGKTGFLAETMQNRGELFACDREPSRVAVLTENLKRLGAGATVIQHDWKNDAIPAAMPRLFDRILLDAPCTNTGVIRRRVDVRWRLTSDNFARMQKEQLAILRAVVPLLKVGGVLVYSTCSIEADENEQVVQAAQAEFPFFRLETAKSVLPFRDQFDGAFAAKLIREG